MSIVTGPEITAAVRAGGNTDRQHPLAHLGQADLHRSPLLVGDPAGQPRRSGRAQARHPGELLACHIGAVSVQTDQELLPGQLGRSDPHQQLASLYRAISRCWLADLPFCRSPGRSCDAQRPCCSD